ncbi:uncharacterized protein LOC116080166 [Mastomys coucha]|uniref:uncharacterized protein LOC116080166 n=1 Tax=Mastomys coucha TaxID=35658 RepID=UPI00126254FF|nr:uncharacterized protein LOC116080166 [Mastomys coucha]XP_031212310.1 uncharacterized protein LOC116080166 [Mastomys coucha]
MWKKRPRRTRKQDVDRPYLVHIFEDIVATVAFKGATTVILTTRETGPSMVEAEARGSLRVQSQPVLHKKFQDKKSLCRKTDRASNKPKVTETNERNSFLSRDESDSAPRAVAAPERTGPSRAAGHRDRGRGSPGLGQGRVSSGPPSRTRASSLLQPRVGKGIAERLTPVPMELMVLALQDTERFQASSAAPTPHTAQEMLMLRLDKCPSH